MNTSERSYEFRCPVHGFILLNDQEREIVNQPAFQRLRHIRQLAWTEMVYPGAVHTRFEHSLGVMHVATLLYDGLVRRSKDALKSELGYDDAGLARYRSLVRLVALLHDVGHGPFSHAAEELAPLKPDGKQYAHEEYSAAIIRTYFRDVIETHPAHKNHGFSAEDVAGLLEGKAEAGDALFWRGLTSGQLDADRMDYLLRDSLHAGVRYGQYDLERLVNAIEVIPHAGESDTPRIGIGYGGVHSAEALILARYFMFTQVYFHKTRVIYNYHLEEALREILPGGVLPPPVPGAKGLTEYLKWDDWRVFGELSREKGGKHGKILRERNHYRRVFETAEVPDSGDSDRLSQAKTVLNGLIVVEKTAGKDWYKAQGQDLPVRESDGRVRPLSFHSNVVRELKPSSQTRLYVPLESRNEALSRLRNAEIINKEIQ